jgi:hypothetical protein
VRISVPQPDPRYSRENEAAFRQELERALENIPDNLWPRNLTPVEVEGDTEGNVALQNLLAALEGLGLIVDSTT